MQFKQIPITDAEQSAALGAYCFPHSSVGDPLTYVKKALQKVYALGAYEDEKLLAQLYIVPFEMNVHGVFYKMGGIATVSTYPEKRGSGETKELLTESLRVMKENGQTISSLAPFSKPFYRKVGYEVFFEKVNYKIPVEGLRIASKPKGNVERFVPSDSKRMQEVKNLYDSIVANTNGLTRRDDEWWEELHENPKTFYALSLDPNGNATGFLRYKIENGTFFAMDWFAINHEAVQLLMDFMYHHRSQLGTIEANLPVRDSFAATLTDPEVNRTVYFDKMIRIVDVEAFLKKYPFSFGHQTLRVTIDDETAEWNHQTFEIQENGAVSARGLNESDKGLQMKIGPFSAMMMGYQPVDWYRWHGFATGDPSWDDKWKAALPIDPPQFHDDF